VAIILRLSLNLGVRWGLRCFFFWAVLITAQRSFRCFWNNPVILNVESAAANAGTMPIILPVQTSATWTPKYAVSRCPVGARLGVGNWWSSTRIFVIWGMFSLASLCLDYIVIVVRPTANYGLGCGPCVLCILYAVGPRRDFFAICRFSWWGRFVSGRAADYFWRSLDSGLIQNEFNEAVYLVKYFMETYIRMFGMIFSWMAKWPVVILLDAYLDRDPSQRHVLEIF